MIAKVHNRSHCTHAVKCGKRQGQHTYKQRAYDLHRLHVNFMVIGADTGSAANVIAAITDTERFSLNHACQ